MKTRNGFVSNSSSSSFVIDTKSYPDVFALADAMVCIRDLDWASVDGSLMRQSRNLRAIIKQGRQFLDLNMPISFPTTNYDTFIIKHGSYYVVSTCNNHGWHSQLEGILPNIPEEIQSVFQGDNEGFYEIQLLEDFWYPKYGIIGRVYMHPQRGGRVYCEQHHIPHIKVKDNGVVLCPECALGSGGSGNNTNFEDMVLNLKAVRERQESGLSTEEREKWEQEKSKFLELTLEDQIHIRAVEYLAEKDVREHTIWLSSAMPKIRNFFNRRSNEDLSYYDRELLVLNLSKSLISASRDHDLRIKVDQIKKMFPEEYVEVLERFVLD